MLNRVLPLAFAAVLQAKFTVALVIVLMFLGTPCAVAE